MAFRDRYGLVVGKLIGDVVRRFGLENFDWFESYFLKNEIRGGGDGVFYFMSSLKTPKKEAHVIF